MPSTRWRWAERGQWAGPVQARFDARRPRKLLREQLAEIVGKSLRPEQIERYRRESEQRAASRKRAVVRYMVARADQTLVLSVEQREKLVLALTENYSDAWERAVSLWMNNVQYMPSIPDAQIVPLLSENQKTVWRGIPKIELWLLRTNGLDDGFGHGGHQGVAIGGGVG